MSVAVGIDLGTTNTAVAFVRDGTAFTIADAAGRKVTPSVVSFHPSGTVLVGYGALDRRLIDPQNTIYSVKRLIGRSWESPEVKKVRSRFPFELLEGPKHDVVVNARDEKYTLPEISAFVLRHVKATAEAALGTTVDRAVITVPANFNDPQRAATKLAGKLAGLEVLRILNEPTAAALSYGRGGDRDARRTDPGLGPSRDAFTRGERVAIYDLGGGTFDVTILDLSNNVFEVLATAGDTSLGGDDFDHVISEKIAEGLLRAHRFDSRTNPQAYGKIRIAAESLKRELSGRDQASLELDDLAFGVGGKLLSYQFDMSRAELEKTTMHLVDRTFDVCNAALARANLKTADIDRVIMVGGATRMPIIPHKVENFFGRAPYMRVNPEEVVALGAAIQANALDRPRKVVKKTQVVVPAPVILHEPSKSTPAKHLPATAPIAVAAPVPVPVAHAAPAAGHMDFETFEPAPPIKVPLAPSLGPTLSEAKVPSLPSVPAAVRISEVTKNEAPSIPPVPRKSAPLLIDVTPLSLSVETVGGYCDVLIEGNSPVPCDRTRVFLTATDSQTSVFVRVSQGESNRFRDNTFLGEVELSGIAPLPRGEVQIAVTFEIDADGILNVRAKDVKTGQETKARMHLFGAQMEEHELAAMHERQARRAVH